jgi:hypothetical protein
MNLKKIGKVFTSKFVGTGRGPCLIKKNLPGRGLTKVEKHCPRLSGIFWKGEESVSSAGHRTTVPAIQPAA